MKTISIKSPSNGGDRAPNRHLFQHQMKLLVLGMGYNSMNCWPRGPKQHRVAICCFLQTAGKASLLEIMPTQLSRHRHIKLVSTESLRPYGLVFFMEEGTLHTTQGEK